MALSHKKLAQKRAKKKLARKNKTRTPVTHKQLPQTPQTPQTPPETFRREPLSGDTIIIA
ncbi:hypothetical protein N8955_01135 [bacterium]|nr:hypothetical protein [bacterium]